MDNKKEIIKEEKRNILPVKLADDVNVGMSKVDPLDIRPPMVLLIQKSSSLEDFTDEQGNTPKLGQFFHNGKMKIIDSFDCYILFAAKSTWNNRRKPELGPLPQYKAIGACAIDFTMFAMNFRSSALYTLSGLFTAAKSMNRPMYSLKCTIEAKSLENKDGKWWIPAVRKIEAENDPEKLKKLYDMAHALDVKADKIAEEQEEEITEKDLESVPF